MSRLIAAFIFLFAPLGFSQSQSALSQAEASAIARTAAEEFAKGRSQDMHARFSIEMSDAMDVQDLEEFRRSLSASAGAFRNVAEDVSCEMIKEFQRCEVGLVYDLQRIPLRIVMNAKGEIAGLWRVPPTWEWVSLFSIPFLVIAPVGAIFHFLPVMRKETFFAVRVAGSFRESVPGITILRRYRIINATLTSVGIGLFVYGILANRGLSITAGSLVQPVGMIGALLHARHRVWPHRHDSAPPLRTAYLPAVNPLPGWMLPLWCLPALIVLVAGTTLGLNWERIPTEFPIHWGLNGQPDRWATKSLKNTFGILLVGASAMLLCYGLAAGMVFGARRSASEGRMIRAYSISLIGIMTGVSLLFSAISLNVLRENPNAMPLPMGLVLLAGIIFILVAIVPMWRATTAATEQGDPTPDESWRIGGLVYWNPDDPAWMVRNRIGYGFSPNWAHPMVRVVFPALVLQLLLVLIYVAT